MIDHALIAPRVPPLDREIRLAAGDHNPVRPIGRMGLEARSRRLFLGLGQVNVAAVNITISPGDWKLRRMSLRINPKPRGERARCRRQRCR
jgi:hypothetical protein